MSKHAHLANLAFNRPIAMEPGYARVFYSAFASKIGIEKLIDVNGEVLEGKQLGIEAASYSKTRSNDRVYRVVDGIAVIPVEGTLTHKLGTINSYSGMTGYDGILYKLEQAMNDPEVRGVMLDNNTPGGMVSGMLDTADIIARYRDIKPIWALADDMNCSAGQSIASACSRRLITQTGTAGSFGAVMAHTNISALLEKQGTEITLIHAGAHKVDGNPHSALPADVKEKWQGELDAIRLSFATKAADHMGMDVKDILATEAATFTGQAAVDVGFADEVVNSSDAIGIMIEHLNAQDKTSIGVSMSLEKDKSKAVSESKGGDADSKVEIAPVAGADSGNSITQERERIFGILQLPEAEGRGTLANQLANMEGMNVDQAKGILSAAGLEEPQQDASVLAELSKQHGTQLESSAEDETGNKHKTAVSLLVKSDQG
jgi:ClpP class serine protease